MSGRLTESRLFLAEFRRNFRTTGALLPSGQRLCKALAHFVRDRASHEPRRILEVGPGTGAVTSQLVRILRPDDQLDLVELNESFVDCLQKRFQTDPVFVPYSHQVRILHCPVEDLAADSAYNVVVSGLPLNNFAVHEVEDILGVLKRVAVPGATLSFFEYMGIRTLKRLVSGNEERKRLRGIGQVVGSLLAEQEVRRDWIWLNVLPAWVHHVKL